MNFHFLLYPFALLYGLVIRTRNVLYNMGFLSVTGFECPILSVGNLSTGGTGKTPHIEYLIRLLKPPFKIATLSRGYGRKSKGFHMVKPTMHVLRTGDEPLQFKTKFPDIKVAIGERRVPAMMRLLASYPHTNVVLLDDAFQHRAIKPGLSILLTDYRKLFIHDHLLPMGTLREPVSSMKRAHIILVTKTPEDVSDDSLMRIRLKIKLVPPQLLFFTCLKYGPLKPVHTFFPSLQNDELNNRQVIAFSGLASPGSFIAYLKSKAVSVKHIRFRDHHQYTKRDIEGIRKSFNQIPGNNKIIITTEKDWMRIINEPIRKILDGVPVYTLEVFVDFIDPKEKEIFDQKIIKYVEKI